MFDFLLCCPWLLLVVSGCCLLLSFRGGSVRFFFTVGPWARVFFGCGAFLLEINAYLSKKKNKGEGASARYKNTLDKQIQNTHIWAQQTQTTNQT